MEALETGDEIGKSVIYQYLYAIVSVLSGFLFYIYIVRVFTTEVVGVVALLSAMMILFSTIFSVGLGFGVQHFISYYIGKNDPGSLRVVVKEISIVLIIVSILAIVFMWFSSPAFAYLFFHTYRYLYVIRIMGFAVVASLGAGVTGGMVLGLQKFRVNALINIAYTVVMYSSIVILLQYWVSPLVVVLGWTAGNSLGTLLFSIHVARRIRGMKSSAKAVSVRTIIDYSLPLFISSLLGYGATYVDRFVVSFFLNLSEMGIYNFSLLIVSALGILIGPFSTILLPKLSELYGRGDIENLRLYSSKAIELLLAFYVPVSLVVAAISPSILLFLASPSYLPGFIPITVITITNALFISSNILTVSLQAVRKTRIFLLSSSLALISNFIISILLIPRFGINGAAVGFSSIYIMGFAVTYYYSRKYETAYFEKGKIAKIMLSGAIMFSIVFALQMYYWYSPLKMIAYILLGFTIYVLLIRLLGTFSGEDIEMFMKLLPKALNIKAILRKLVVK